MMRWRNILSGLKALPAVFSAHRMESLLLFVGLLCVAFSVGFTPMSAQSSPVVSADSKPIRTYLSDNDLIRVGIVRSGFDNLSYNDMQIEGTQGLRVFKGLSSAPQQRIQPPILAIPPGVRLTITRPSADGFVLRWLPGIGQPMQELFVPEVIWIQSASPAGLLSLPSIQRRGKTPMYRGIFEMLPDPKAPQNFTAVNILPLKDYLSAVVPNELPLSFGLEAVKAQAVLARNYAINPREKPWKHFDICDTEYCQAYYGAGSEDPKVTQLLSQTEGQVALYRGEPILALYSSTHGGVSENHENVFPNPSAPASANLPYLKGRSDYPLNRDLSVEENARWYYTSKPESFDVNSPLYRWTRTFTGPEYASTLEKNLKSITKNTFQSGSIQCFDTRSNALSALDFGQLLAVKPSKRGVSGKILELDIRTSTLACTVNKEYTIRKLFESGGKALPSANFVVTEKKDAAGKVQTVTLNGGGFGHGVGMSQYGAGWMAQHGYRYGDIIRHYYKDTLLGTIPVTLTGVEPRRLEFISPASRAQLVLEAPAASQIMVTLNGKPLPTLTLPPSKAGSPLSLMTMDVSSYLKPNTMNLIEATSGTSMTATGKLWLEF